MSQPENPSTTAAAEGAETAHPGSGYEPDVLRRWSDAFAGAGLFTLALQVYPVAAEGSENPPPARELVHRAELNVLAGDNTTALRLLSEFESQRDDDLAEPAIALMTAVARAQQGCGPDAWDAVQAAAGGLPELPWRAWMLALGGVAVPDLAIAGPAARTALDGGCRDPRLALIAAAGTVAGAPEPGWEQCAEAVTILERARRVQLPSEDAIGGALELLRRAGQADRAAALANFAVTDAQLPASAREAWRAVAAQLEIAVPRKRLRLSTGELPNLLPRARNRHERGRSLTCRCAGSTGWIGPDRRFYIENHLETVDERPIPDLDASLLRCPLTSTRFLDLPVLELTLPVDLG